jgi:xanthine dehydrogenase YagR molybdenum-binding subunit
MRQMRGTASASDLPDACIAGGSAHTVTAGMAIHNAGAAIIAKLADLATGDQRSPLFGAGNAGLSRAAAVCSFASMKGAARATPPSSAAPA